MTVVRSDRRGTVLTLTLDRPEKFNALSPALVEELLAGVRAAYAEPTDVLVLRGNGPTFSAGFDLSGLDAMSDGDLLYRFVQVELLLQAVHHAPFATIALAHGQVFGAGADLVSSCTHRIAAPDTRFRFPGMAFGLVLGSGRLGRRVGPDTARQIQVGGLAVDADRALRIGLVTDVRPTEEWDDFVTEFAANEAKLSRPARAVLHTALHEDHRDRDLAALVRSAAEPGITDRIREYAAARRK